MRFWASVSLALVFGAATAGRFAQTPGTASTTRKPDVHRRFNEFTLAGLRPGRDKLAKAIRMFGRPDTRSADRQSAGWSFERAGGAFYLNLDLDKADVVQFIRVSTNDGPSGVNLAKHTGLENSSWGSGRGLALGATGSRVLQLYGDPDSRSPSAKDGRKLELLYYAFDWAGSDVPQVMEVLCTVEDDGKPGRVVEITLAAPSL